MTIVRRNCHCSHAVFSGDYGDYVTDEEEESAPPLLLLGLVLAALSAAGSAAVVVACRRLRPGHKYQPGPASSQDYHASLHQTSSISTIHTNCTSSNTHNRSAEPGLSSIVVSQLWLYWTYSKLCGMENTETWNGTNYFRKNARTRTINRTIVVSCCSQCRTNRRGRYRLSPSA